MENQRRATLAALLVSSNRLTREAARATGDATPASSRQILSLLTAEGPLRIGAIAAALRLSQPGVTQAAATLEGHGLVSRGPDPADARATVLTLTEAGRAAAVEWRDRLATALEPALAHLTDDDWATLARAAAILDTLDKESL
ncbi:MarR family winged helix-turn-helix transcriptional regulator [Demequina soli]|uniref:MarR family winged helix-turn-helix transcriptional regulator n=1 Tax=Demequina soli TaxID=1638987 RepID=UPI0007818602|nr:MarR family transcriptional regulator [Demequina soli]